MSIKDTTGNSERLGHLFEIEREKKNLNEWCWRILKKCMHGQNMPEKDCRGFPVQEIWQEVGEKGTVIHGDYNYHNIVMTQQGIATTNFDHFANGIQASDLYYFMRKILEKHEWNVELGRAMMRAYQDIRPLSEEEQEYLAIRFSYPEKFWKIMNSTTIQIKHGSRKKMSRNYGLQFSKMRRRNSFWRVYFLFI